MLSPLESCSPSFTLCRFSARIRHSSAEVAAPGSRRRYSCCYADANEGFSPSAVGHLSSVLLLLQVAGVPGVTETLFQAKQSALAEEKKKLDETPMLYGCGLCGKGYRSSKAHDQHLKSKSPIIEASEAPSGKDEESPIIKPLTRRTPKKPLDHAMEEDEESDYSDWVEVDPDNMDEEEDDEDEDDFGDLYPFSRYDAEHVTIEKCMVHMHKRHGFFIPDIEYLKDPKGLLTYMGLKVKRDFMCLYCNERCHPFSSLEAVQKHMEAKNHCKVRYGDGSEYEEAELEDFYDYSSSYEVTDGNQLVCFWRHEECCFTW